MGGTSCRLTEAEVETDGAVNEEPDGIIAVIVEIVMIAAEEVVLGFVLDCAQVLGFRWAKKPPGPAEIVHGAELSLEL